jgi:hypothetical protein
MAKVKGVDYRRLNQENVAIGQMLVGMLGTAIAQMTDLALHCNEQAQEIEQLRAQLAAGRGE